MFWAGALGVPWAASRGELRGTASRRTVSPLRMQALPAVPAQSFRDLFSAALAPMVEVRGKRALVTGASAGIGKATACALAALGCNLVLVARRRDRLEEIQKAIVDHDLPVSVELVAADVTKDECYAALEACNGFDVDFLINNAGLARGKDPVGQALVSDWQEMIDANCTAAFRMTNAVVPKMLQRGGGHIVATGSIAGLENYEGGSVYCASKSALHAFMKCLRFETYSKNIRCTVVAPGLVGEGTEFSEVRFRGNVETAAATYEDIDELRASDVATQIVWALRQPAHVCLDLIHVMPTSQGGATRVHRGGKAA